MKNLQWFGFISQPLHCQPTFTVAIYLRHILGLEKSRPPINSIIFSLLSSTLSGEDFNILHFWLLKSMVTFFIWICPSLWQNWSRKLEDPFKSFKYSNSSRNNVVEHILLIFIGAFETIDIEHDDRLTDISLYLFLWLCSIAKVDQIMTLLPSSAVSHISLACSGEIFKVIRLLQNFIE